MLRIFLHLQEDIEQQKSKSGPARVRRLASEWKESAVEKIAQNVRKGPLLFLKQTYFLGNRIKVYTRHARGIRGSCTGSLCILGAVHISTLETAVQPSLRYADIK